MALSINAYTIYLFVNTKAYPLISLGTTPSNLNSTLEGCEFVKFFDTFYRKQINYTQHQ